MNEVMDTKELAAIGQRSGRSGRRSYTLEEKLRIIEETLQPGISISRVARAHDINDNLVSNWRRQHALGELAGSARRAQKTALLPIHVASTNEQVVVAPAQKANQPQSGVIEIHLSGARICVQGCVDSKVLAEILGILDRR